MGKFYNNVKTAVLLGVLSSIILAAGYFIGGGSLTGVYIALGIAAVMNFVGFFFSDKIALASMGAEEVGADHELYQIVEPLAQRAGLPMPKVYVSSQQAPNAFATGRSPSHAAVCATEGLLATLSRNEVAGVMAHELAHVKHRDTLIQATAATIAAALSVLAYSTIFGGIGGRRDGEGGGGNPLIGLLILILGPLAAGLIQAAISRSREFNADTEGGEICGDPMHLATALEKIHRMAGRVPMDVNPAFNSMMIAEPLNFSAGGMAKMFSTHPPLEERLENLIGRPSVR